MKNLSVFEPSGLNIMLILDYRVSGTGTVLIQDTDGLWLEAFPSRCTGLQAVVPFP